MSDTLDFITQEVDGNAKGKGEEVTTEEDLSAIPYPPDAESMSKQEEKLKNENFFWKTVRNNDLG